MSLRTRIAAWESNVKSNQSLRRYQRQRDDTRRQLPGKPGSEMPVHRPVSHEDYIARTDQKTMAADFRSGRWRIIRRGLGVVATGVVAYGMITDPPELNNGLPAQQRMVHEVSSPIEVPSSEQQPNDSIASVSVVDFQ